MPASPASTRRAVAGGRLFSEEQDAMPAGGKALYHQDLMPLPRKSQSMDETDDGGQGPDGGLVVVQRDGAVPSFGAIAGRCLRRPIRDQP